MVKLTYSLNTILHVIPLTENIGADGWNGHRVYAGMPAMVNSDFIAYLDQDNTFDENHLFSLYQMIHLGELQWGFSLRKIICGETTIEDNCESLGNISPTAENESITSY